MVFLKIIPYIMALGYVLNVTLGFVYHDFNVINYSVSCSITTWIFMYLSSFVFQFCVKHRLPLYYILINDALTIIDYYVGIPISTHMLLYLHLAIIAFFVLEWLYLTCKS